MDPNIDGTRPTPESVEIVVPGPEPAPPSPPVAEPLPSVASVPSLPEPEIVVPGPEPEMVVPGPEPEIVVPGPEPTTTPTPAPGATDEPEIVVPGPGPEALQAGEPVPPAPPGSLIDAPTEPETPAPLGDVFSAGPRGRIPRTFSVPRALIIAVAAVLTVALLGAGYAFYALRGTGDVLAADVPADSAVYVTIYLDPSAGQKLDLHRLIAAFPQLRSAGDGGVPHLVNGFLASVGSGLSYEEDVRPWLGSQVAFAGRVDQGFGGAVLIASKDDAAATRALAAFRTGPRGRLAHWSETSHQGITIDVGTVHTGDGRQVIAVALVNHAAVIGNDAAFVRRIVDTATGHGSALASSSTFADAIGPLPSDRLALGYVHLPTLMAGALRDLPGGGDVPGGAAALSVFRGMGVSLSAQPDGIALDVHVSVDPNRAPAELTTEAHPNPALAAVPQGAYGVYAFEGLASNLGSQLGPALGQPPIRRVAQRLGLANALAALSGDGAFEMGPGRRYPGGAILLGTTNDAALRTFLARLGDMVAAPLAGHHGKPRWHTSTHRGVTIHTLTATSLRRAGLAPSYAVADGLAIVASSPKELNRILDARATGASLSSSETYRATVAHVDDPSAALLFVDLQAVGRGIRANLAPGERGRFDAETVPWLVHLRGVALSQAGGHDGYSLRMFVLIG